MAETLTRKQAADKVRSLIRAKNIRVRFRDMVRQFCAEFTGEYPFPFPRNRDLTLAEQYAVLSALYDSEELGEPIDPWHGVPPSSADSKASIPYGLLAVGNIKTLQGSQKLTDILSDVEADLQANGLLEVSGNDDKVEKLAKKVETIDRRTRPTAREKLKQQRLKFIRPRVAKRETWTTIYTAYILKYPSDPWKNAVTREAAMRVWYGNNNCEATKPTN